MGTRVYSYGARPPTAQAQKVQDDLAGANRYRNALCELERRRRDQVSAALRSIFPRIGELEEAAAAIEAELDQDRSAIRRANADRRSRIADPAAKQKISDLKQRRRAIYDDLRAEKTAAFGPEHYIEARKKFGKTRDRVRAETKKRDVSGDPAVTASVNELRQAEERWFTEAPGARELNATLAKIDAEANREHKRLRAECGLGTGTYLAIEAAAEKFRSGAPPKFKRYRGDGRVGVQVQGGLSARSLLDAEKGQLSLSGYDPEQTGKQRAVTRIRVASEGRRPVWADVPTTFHRPIPHDAKIKWAYLRRRKIGTRSDYRMQLTLDRADAQWVKPRMADRGVVAIDVGWRKVDSGLRVAFWVGNDGREGELVLPQALLDRFALSKSLRSRRDEKSNTALPLFMEWVRLNAADLPEWLDKRVRGKPAEEGKKPPISVHAWKGQARLASVVTQWFKNRFPADREIFPIMEEWFRQDETLWNREAWGRERAIRWRDEIYRVFAARIRSEYRTAVVEKINWRKMQENPAAESERDGVVGSFHEAAVGSLIEKVKQSMGETSFRDPKDTSSIHFDCGQPCGESNRAGLFYTCSACGVTFDQDRNAALNLLGRHAVAIPARNG